MGPGFKVGVLVTYCAAPGMACISAIIPWLLILEGRRSESILKLVLSHKLHNTQATAGYKLL
ncbi:hypothetical protein BDR04DRAFT_1103975 [Suillus decipiens]|nr:hypothetical protein BDR04DRAFT_1103975 [Suillus decipiens]